MNFVLPRRFTLPTTLTPYDELSDPKKYIKKFTSIMIVNGAFDKVLCHYFPSYLDGLGLDWFCSLPAGSISRFRDLSKLFEEHFAGSAIYLHDSDYLNTIRQDQQESLKDYMTRFTKIAMSIPDLHPEVELHAIKSRLRPGKFLKTIAVAKPKTMAEFREKAKGQIDIEELRQARKIEKPHYRDNDKTRDNKKNFKPTPQYESYTKFNTKRDDIIKEILNSKLIKPPRKAGSYPDSKGGGATRSARKRSYRAMLFINADQTQQQPLPQSPQITFQTADHDNTVANLDDPVVISLHLRDLLVKKVLFDPGSSADILFYSIFQKIKLSSNILQPSTGDLVGFSGERVPVMGSVWLQTTLGEFSSSKTSDIQYLDITIATIHSDAREAME
ncbi:uncharacterized protein [Arachis hypogaea]|uniref:uncharacterized protein n=1 Tax=Arachis hypogaea TaxID=3818 RepID=UPI003B20DCD9